MYTPSSSTAQSATCTCRAHHSCSARSVSHDPPAQCCPLMPPAGQQRRFYGLANRAIKNINDKKCFHLRACPDIAAVARHTRLAPVETETMKPANKQGNQMMRVFSPGFSQRILFLIFAASKTLAAWELFSAKWPQPSQCMGITTSGSMSPIKRTAWLPSMVICSGGSDTGTDAAPMFSSAARTWNLSLMPASSSM